MTEKFELIIKDLLSGVEVEPDKDKVEELLRVVNKELELRVKARTQELEKTVSEKASNVTHEVNNPISAILLSCELLRKHIALGDTNPANILKSVDRIQDTCTRLMEIVQRLFPKSSASTQAIGVPAVSSDLDSTTPPDETI